ncbi:MAG: cell wall metabolism sensor histidine kinase WalK [Rubrobacter sp.]|nr:cell wall metabolism sensor histidine kinase WalK [Rubrobacter sp.]
MSSARKLLSRLRPGKNRIGERATRQGGGPGGRFRPRIGMRVWLTALFLLVTAFAGGLTYDIVHPFLYNTLNQASRQSFEQVGEQWENEINRGDEQFTRQDIEDFATSRGLQWGVVRASNGEILQGDAEEWSVEAVNTAVNTQSPDTSRERITLGPRDGQLIATYAAPINLDSQSAAEGQRAAIVFVKFFPESDIGNVDAAMDKIQRIMLLAGALALLIAGISGYVVADLISRRVSRIGLVADRLAAGSFDERIDTPIRDEVGDLGETFNSMAVSLKGAFRQVEQEKERGQAILDGMTDAVIGVDGELNAIFLNPRAHEILGLADLTFHNRLHETLARTRNEGPITEPEIETNSESRTEGRSDAQNQILEIRAAPLEDGALAIIRDVTQERRIQRAKAEFIANASHELKTPLFALSGYLEMLEDEDTEEDVRNAFLKDMRAQTERLNNLARTLLDLSRLDANAVTFNIEEVYLEDLLHDLRRDFGYTGRPIRIEAEETPPVETDPTQLHRMLAILLDNALKYSGKDDPVDLGLTHDVGHATITVHDRGCGIPEEELPYIFDRFYRAQGSSRADGTGLGLALAREITDHLGGDIHVESSPEEGSTFSVSLPLGSEGSRDRSGVYDESRRVS